MYLKKDKFTSLLTKMQQTYPRNMEAASYTLCHYLVEEHIYHRYLNLMGKQELCVSDIRDICAVTKQDPENC